MRPKRPFRVPVEAGGITPDALAVRSIDEMGAMQVWEGNRRRLLTELFVIEGKPGASPGEPIVRFIGDLSKVRRVGAGMSVGALVIEGNCGMHLGEEMRGGSIRVIGDVGPWAGSMMRGGTIEVYGNAGDYLGGGYRGGVIGMRGGGIVVHGSAGNEVGHFMKGGTIEVLGNVGQFTGIHMGGGTILIDGDSEGRAGAEMVGGKIVICGYTPSVLPTFTFEDIRKKVKVDGGETQGPFYMFSGDLTGEGDGRLFISVNRNPHLKAYERFVE